MCVCVHVFIIPYRPMFLENDCAYDSWCPSRTKSLRADASLSRSPVENP